MASKKAATDKRVLDVRAERADDRTWRLLAVSADVTLAELHLALLGAFEFKGSYEVAERVYRFTIDGTVYENGRGSRTVLRKLLPAGAGFEYAAPSAEIRADCEVTASYEVGSRRHYPKVLAGDDACDPRFATWDAQSAMRREFREPSRRSRTTATAWSDAFVHGFFSAIVAGPLVMPSAWLGLLVGTTVPTVEQLNERVGVVMQKYNSIAQALQSDRDGFIKTVASLADADATGAALIDWSRGFARAMVFGGDEWFDALKGEAKELFMPIAMIIQFDGDAERRDWFHDSALRHNVAKAAGVATVGIAELWRRRLVASTHEPARRDYPKIGPNTLCSCGSGKKFKRCCGSPLRVV